MRRSPDVTSQACTRADASVRAAESAGAAVLLAPKTIGLDRIAILTDPQGAAFGRFAGATDR